MVRIKLFWQGGVLQVSLLSILDGKSKVAEPVFPVGTSPPKCPEGATDFGRDFQSVRAVTFDFGRECQSARVVTFCFGRDFQSDRGAFSVLDDISRVSE